jgi:hypothetical protein
VGLIQPDAQSGRPLSDSTYGESAQQRLRDQDYDGFPTELGQEWTCAMAAPSLEKLLCA